MTQQTSANEYKQEIIAFYEAKTNYDNDFTYRRAIPLVELAHLQPGQHILDVATGTGIIAIAAAQIVGSEGKVVGVDFTPGLLDQARRKITVAGLQNEVGFQDIEIKTEQFGSYLSLNDAKNFWQGKWLPPNGHPLLQLSDEQSEQLKAEYSSEVETLATDQRVWHDITTFFVIGCK